ncbi:uncharacterized protein EKO05_0009976 [Ascochyta rabiei]|uniref:uncharacterized protein n=1 Tax=Didymella rabiei TaxID=5454 RepID=UPI00220ABE74|nr:uncharacterized protein EKO05_0009976 [Ascochyta rabiei]UPX19723.1 hypothetical protein EKO05_0009976 [Ascochyta rabiei]
MRQVIGEQSPFVWGSHMEHLTGYGAGVNCKEYVSAVNGGSGKFSKDIGMQAKCLRTSWTNRS